MVDERIARYGIGAKLRAIRHEAGLTPSQLAASAAISEAALRAFEAGEKLPSLEELALLADQLQVRLQYFFQAPPAEQHAAEIVRASDRWTVSPATEAARRRNFRYQALSYRLTERLMSPFLIEIPPDHSIDVEPSAHPGEEFLFVLEGELEARIGGEANHLSQGDALYFSSTSEHSLRARTSRPVRLVACFADVRRKYEGDPLDRAFHVRE